MLVLADVSKLEVAWIVSKSPDVVKTDVSLDVVNFDFSDSNWLRNVALSDKLSVAVVISFELFSDLFKFSKIGSVVFLNCLELDCTGCAFGHFDVVDVSCRLSESISFVAIPDTLSFWLVVIWRIWFEAFSLFFEVAWFWAVVVATVWNFEFSDDWAVEVSWVWIVEVPTVWTGIGSSFWT